MNLLIFWSFVIYAGFQLISSIMSIFAEKELVIQIRYRKCNGLIGLYMVIIITLFLTGVLK